MNVELTPFLNFVLNAFVVVLLLLFSKESLRRIRKILNILDNGGYRDCPHYADQRQQGRRWYDENHLHDVSLNLNEKGGDNL